MRTHLQMQEAAHAHFLGTRHSALGLRTKLIELLKDYDEVVIDFSGLFVSQSFIDELLGQIILTDGPKVMSRLLLKGCQAEVRSIVQLVVNDRSADFESKHCH